MRKALVIAFAVAALAIVPAAAFAQHGGGHGGGGSHGGGSHGGGSHGGGSHGGGSHGGGSHGGHWGGGHWGGGHGGWGHGHGGYYYPSWGWAYPGWAWGWGWGWGWGAGWGWSPYYYGAYYYGPHYAGPAAAWGVVSTDVEPEEARVFLEGRYIGTADDFDGYPDFLYLQPGQYHLEFRLEGYETQAAEIDARAGVRINLNNKLKKIPGSKQYGSYHTPTPEGGILRFWGKRGGAVVAYDGARDAGPSGNDIEARPDGPQSQPPPSPEPRDDAWRQGTSAPEPARVKQGRLVLSVVPGDAVVYLDDRFLGIAQEIAGAERGIPLAPGKHTLSISRPGFKTRTMEFDVAPGESKTVEISLDNS
jgi:hypothetical protein